MLNVLMIIYNYINKYKYINILIIYLYMIAVAGIVAYTIIIGTFIYIKTNFISEDNVSIDPEREYRVTFTQR